MMTVDLDSFSPDYTTARERFRLATAKLDWDFEDHSIEGRGPGGESLTIDVARHCVNGSDQVMVISSGLHGVEGFFGAAVQLELLRRWANGSPPRVNIVLLHSLNPYGFAWLRRFDQNNVDLNRNFLLEGESYTGSPPSYASLDNLLNPQRPPSKWDLFRIKSLLMIAKHGLPSLRQSIAGGQYDFPRGLFFGGSGPSELQQLLSNHCERWLSGFQNLVHLDFHTGLGPYGKFKLLLDSPLDACQQNQMVAWFGDGTFEKCDTSQIAYAARGGLGQWCVARRIVPNYLFACAEFGTYGPLAMLAGLRTENQTHQYLSASSKAVNQAKLRLKELFCPAAPRWRTEVLQQSVQLVDRAERGLADL